MRELIDIVDQNWLLEEDASTGPASPLKNVDRGMFDSWENDDICLFGGWRVGSSPAGYLRVGYVILDVPIFNQTGDQQAAEMGNVHVYRDNENRLAALINIELDKTKRKEGVGGRVVRALAATHDDHLVIIDIRPKAVGFWKKMGCEFYYSNGTPVTTPTKPKTGTTLLGIIRKPGSNTPLNQLPAFSKGATNTD